MRQVSDDLYNAPEFVKAREEFDAAARRWETAGEAWRKARSDEFEASQAVDAAYTAYRKALKAE